MAPKHSLLYFDVRGRGEAIRMLFKYGGVEFEDKRLSFEEWGPMKDDVNVTPNGYLPVLTTECGKKLVQTSAVIRYVANELNIYGSNNVEKAVIDSLIDTNKELHDAIVEIVFFTPKEEDKVPKREALEKKVHPAFKYFELRIKENEGNTYFVGKTPSVADIYFLDVMDNLNAVFPGNTFLDQYLLLKNIDTTTRATDNLKKYLAERK